MAEFHVNAIAFASDFDASGVMPPTCFKCKKAQIVARIDTDDAIVWSCPRCKAQGRISNWQDTLWDLSHREPHG